MFLLMKNNFLARFWRGDIKLWISYWLCGVLLQYIVLATEIYVSLKFNIPQGIIAYAYAMFWCVGTWRAAKKYTGKPRWAELSKFSVMLTVILYNGFLLIVLTY